MELAIVPRPGSSRSGIQRSSTTRLITITAVPMLIGRWIAIPWWSTSHGALPSVARISIASVTPYRTSPTVSCASLRVSRPAFSWAIGPRWASSR